ncbi:tryptophan dimethylallyltransferase domain-containing protein [Apiospora rasikravindrae]|uniref:Tryptophan dimethylallyltransferase domain-containing protein n=1 Tax=Apiospora rasikravindrae TaxID=990691 RepID=A0ABR1TEN0_9PEZI
MASGAPTVLHTATPPRRKSEATFGLSCPTPPWKEEDALSLQTPVANEPWSLLNHVLQFRSTDAQFWWERTGHVFARLLRRAGYTPAEQYRELLFYALFVAPELGLAPDENGNVRGWRSPGTPDSTPIDFSWEWATGDHATVRYSFEPIGAHAGTPLDPLNRSATNRWIAKLRKQNMVPGLDLEWYDHFTGQILPHEDMERTKTADIFVEETTPKAGTVVALDLEKTGPVMKMYIYPGLKAEELGITNLQLVQQSIRSLPQYASLRVEPLLAYLDEGTAKYGFETGILGIDCLRPEEGARIKIYSDEAVADLRDFWNAFLADAPAVLPADAPGRASPGFYYTVGCDQDISPKVYISPGYFCKSDADVLDRLRKFFSTRRSDSMMDNYEKAMQDIFDAQTLGSRCGSQYYVGCALHKNKLRVVTYLSPQTFDCERDLISARRGMMDS